MPDHRGKTDELNVLVGFGNTNSKSLSASALQQIKPNTKLLGRCVVPPGTDIKIDPDTRLISAFLDTIIDCRIVYCQTMSLILAS